MTCFANKRLGLSDHRRVSERYEGPLVRLVVRRWSVSLMRLRKRPGPISTRSSPPADHDSVGVVQDDELSLRGIGADPSPCVAAEAACGL